MAEEPFLFSEEDVALLKKKLMVWTEKSEAINKTLADEREKAQELETLKAQLQKLKEDIASDELSYQNDDNELKVRLEEAKSQAPQIVEEAENPELKIAEERLISAIESFEKIQSTSFFEEERIKEYRKYEESIDPALFHVERLIAKAPQPAMQFIRVNELSGKLESEKLAKAQRSKRISYLRALFQRLRPESEDFSRRESLISSQCESICKEAVLQKEKLNELRTVLQQLTQQSHESTDFLHRDPNETEYASKLEARIQVISQENDEIEAHNCSLLKAIQEFPSTKKAKQGEHKVELVKKQQLLVQLARKKDELIAQLTADRASSDEVMALTETMEKLWREHSYLRDLNDQKETFESKQKEILEMKKAVLQRLGEMDSLFKDHSGLHRIDELSAAITKINHQLAGVIAEAELQLANYLEEFQTLSLIVSDACL